MGASPGGPVRPRARRVKGRRLKSAIMRRREAPASQFVQVRAMDVDDFDADARSRPISPSSRSGSKLPALKPLSPSSWGRRLEALAQATFADLKGLRKGGQTQQDGACDGPGRGARKDPADLPQRQRLQEAQQIHTPSRSTSSPAGAEAMVAQKSLSTFARAQSPLRLFLEVAAPLWDGVLAFCGTPSELLGAFMVCRPEDVSGNWFRDHPQWEVMFGSRWPAMHCALSFARTRDWRRAFVETSRGSRSCLLEVFDRERKLGFAMSAHPAVCRWDQRRQAYVAKYLSVSDVPEEYIPYHDGQRRLRFCPPSAQAGITCPYSGGIDPFRVLPLDPKALEELQEAFAQGQGIELQWKMRAGGPFGWWYAEVEAIEARGSSFYATLLFRHFPESSPWYRLLVPISITSPEPCAIGGFCGGIRRCTDEEQVMWRRYLHAHAPSAPRV